MGDRALMSKPITNSFSLDGHLRPVHTTDNQLWIYNHLTSLNGILQFHVPQSPPQSVLDLTSLLIYSWSIIYSVHSASLVPLRSSKFSKIWKAEWAPSSHIRDNQTQQKGLKPYWRLSGHETPNSCYLFEMIKCWFSYCLYVAGKAQIWDC